MEIRHKCKLCSRTFNNGRALGGHMKAHLAALPVPPPKPQPLVSFSCSSESDSSDSEEQEVVTQREKLSEEKALMYGLRENPKKSFRLADPEFSAAFCAPVQDRESETESKNHNNPTRQRSKRNSKPAVFPFSPEPEPVSSVSDPSPDEDVAMWLMMLSRDTRRPNVNNVGLRSEQQQNHNKKHFKNRVRGKNLCETCGKVFRSSRALASHKSICCREEERKNNQKIFECPFCYKAFGSGQALGGHKRSHLIASSSSISTVNHSVRLKESFIDLNLPAPMEEDELSVLSDA